MPDFNPNPSNPVGSFGGGRFNFSSGGGGGITAAQLAAILSSSGSASVVTYNGDATWTHDDGDGNTSIIDLNAALADLTAAGVTNLMALLDFSALTAAQITDLVAIFDFTQMSAQQIQDIANAIAGDATALAALVAALPNDSLVYNSDATWTHTANDGTAVTIDMNAAFSDLTAAGVTALNAQIDPSQWTAAQIAALLAALGTDKLVDNGDATWTHTALDGTAVIIDMNAGFANLTAAGQANLLAAIPAATATDVEAGTDNAKFLTSAALESGKHKGQVLQMATKSFAADRLKTHTAETSIATITITPVSSTSKLLVAVHPNFEIIGSAATTPMGRAAVFAKLREGSATGAVHADVRIIQRAIGSACYDQKAMFYEGSNLAGPVTLHLTSLQLYETTSHGAAFGNYYTVIEVEN